MSLIDAADVEGYLEFVQPGHYITSAQIGENLVNAKRFKAIPPQPFNLEERQTMRLLARTIDLVLIYRLPLTFYRIYPTRGWPFTVAEIEAVRQAAWDTSPSGAAVAALAAMDKIDPTAFDTANYLGPKQRSGQEVIPASLEAYPTRIAYELRDPLECLREEAAAIQRE